MAIPTEQIEFLASTPWTKRQTFIEKFMEKFKVGNLPSDSHNRASYIWQHRGDLKQKLTKIHAEAELRNRTVMVPARIVNKSPRPERGDDLPDVGELLVKQTNLLAEIVALQKEQIANQQKEYALLAAWTGRLQ